MQDNINKLVSLTFDENPEVRKLAAKSLGELGDPAAAFALVELSFDKDPSVREIAAGYLEKRRQAEPELMSFANIFATGKKEDEITEAKDQPPDSREKMLLPITQIFEKRLGKEKADVIKSRMMPSIEKMYMKAHQQPGKKKTDEDGRKAMQEFLTSYLEVMSGIEQIGSAAQGLVHPPQQVQHQQVHEVHEQEQGSGDVEEASVDSDDDNDGHDHQERLSDQSQQHSSNRDDNRKPHHDQDKQKRRGETDAAGTKAGLGELEEIGKQTHLDSNISSEIANLELQGIAEMKEDYEVEHLPDTFFKKAYELMMLSGGDDEIMKSEMHRMIEEATREIGLAFRLAKKRFKEMKITNLTRLKDGMRNVNTDTLTVRSIEEGTYQKSKKQAAPMLRVVVNDDAGNEGIVYLLDGRGAGLKAGMRIKVVRGLAKTFPNETALTVGKKGNIYIVL